MRPEFSIRHTVEGENFREYLNNNRTQILAEYVTIFHPRHIVPLQFIHLAFQSMYTEVSETLYNKVERLFGEQLTPSFISTDIEIAAMNAVRVTFPNCRICGCLCHYSQILWRKVQT